MDKTNELILQTVRRVEDNQASMDRDMEKDRQNIQDLTIRIEALESEIRQVRQAVNLSAERTRDKVVEAVEPVVESSERLASQIKRSKKVFIKPKSWWKRFLEGLE